MIPFGVSYLRRGGSLALPGMRARQWGYITGQTINVNGGWVMS